MHKKIILLILCMAMLLLISCNGSSPASPSTPNTIPIYTATPLAPEKQPTVEQEDSAEQESAEIEATEAAPSEPTTTPEPVSSEPTTTADSAYPAPILPETTDSGYPAPETTIAEFTNVELTYPMAIEAARGWHDEAYFVGIAPAFQMFNNLNIPPQRGGLFFKFTIDDSPDEFFVFAIQNRIGGTTIAQPILLEPLPYTEQEIDIDKLDISSEEFKELFFENEAGTAYVDKELDLDYRLIHLDSSPNPVWSVLEVNSGYELFHIDAMTGEEVENPFAPYIQ